jgi:hypothetical protein
MQQPSVSVPLLVPLVTIPEVLAKSPFAARPERPALESILAACEGIADLV